MAWWVFVFITFKFAPPTAFIIYASEPRKPKVVLNRLCIMEGYLTSGFHRKEEAVSCKLYPPNKGLFLFTTSMKINGYFLFRKQEQEERENKFAK